MREKRISIAVPASVVSDTPHMREKTSKIGLVGRAAAIFRVDEIIIYRDYLKADQASEIRLISSLLSYLETPQYLRKKLFKIRPELQFAGILPPLRTPHHPLNNQAKRLRIGEYREGVILSETGEDMFVDIGVERPVLIRSVRLPINRRVTVRIIETGRQVEVELAKQEDITAYWGYSVTEERNSLGRLVRDRQFDLAIATSKYGSPFAKVAEKILAGWRNSGSILISFGAPMRGLDEIAKQEGLSLSDIFDYVVNTIPLQGTETVRTEEALIATLAILNTRSSA